MTKPLLLWKGHCTSYLENASLLLILKCFDLSSTLTQLFIVSCARGYSSKSTKNNQDTFWQHLSKEKTSMTPNLSHIRFTVSRSLRCELNSSSPHIHHLYFREDDVFRGLWWLSGLVGPMSRQLSAHPKPLSVGRRPCGQVEKNKRRWQLRDHGSTCQ